MQFSELSAWAVLGSVSGSLLARSGTYFLKMTNPRKKRLNLDLTPESYELLQRLADESGVNMSDVLRTGLALYKLAQEERHKGRSLGVMEGDTVVKQIQIVMPL